MTPSPQRQLFDAAVKAGLPIVGLTLLHTVVVRSPAEKEHTHGRTASLADVECAVMDALAETCFVSVDNGAVHWGVEVKAPDGEVHSVFAPTRWQALLAACEALTKETK